MSRSYSASAAPLSIGPKYASSTSGSVSPIIPVRPLESAARAAVRAEAVLAHDLEHGLAGLRRDVGPVVQDPRDGRDRDAREVGDVADRGAAAERRDSGWLSV